MNKITIYYGSRKEFNKLIPKKYRSLTELVYESDKDSKNLHLIVPDSEIPEEKKIVVENFVISSEEYSGVREHVIINFMNFLVQFEVNDLYLQNPPLQISSQILRLYPEAKVHNQTYASLKLENLIEFNGKFSKKIIGQEKAKIELLQSLYPLTMDYRDKPVVLLLYGKPGIGKTESAKFISEIIGEPIFRKQFSMFQNNQFATYLFGGAHYEKSFAKDLLDRESNVILLDEFDKAHSSFHSAFYQLFDEGIYEDQNYTLELKKSIIICTSNYTDLKHIEEHLGSAIYNRFDNIIHFTDLSTESKNEIGHNSFKRLNEIYNVKMDSSTLERLECSYSRCENVREINHLIENTFALLTINQKL